MPNPLNPIKIESELNNTQLADQRPAEKPPLVGIHGDAEVRSNTTTTDHSNKAIADKLDVVEAVLKELLRHLREITGDRM